MDLFGLFCVFFLVFLLRVFFWFSVGFSVPLGCRFGGSPGVAFRRCASFPFFLLVVVVLFLFLFSFFSFSGAFAVASSWLVLSAWRRLVSI